MGARMLINTKNYIQIVSNVKQEILLAQQRIINGANRELVALYWKVGKIINEQKSWGDKFIENLAHDIKTSFPSLRVFSVRNLKYMSKFAKIYAGSEKVQQVLHNLPWRHNIALMDKLDNQAQREWYAVQSLKNGWSSNILEIQIETNLYKRQVLADKTTNFKKCLPAPQSDMAQQALKDPYIFDFIENRQGMIEREIEDGLVGHITKFLLELGTGFSFVGQQYHMEVGDQDFYIDLLFYNLKLRYLINFRKNMRIFFQRQKTLKAA